MRRAAFLLAMLSTAAAQAAPCVSRHASIAPDRLAAWARVAEVQMTAELHRSPVVVTFAVTGARVKDVYRSRAWFVLYVETDTLDPSYLFFPGDPAATAYVAHWSGAAMLSERAEIRAWVRKNAPGIPYGLAACFAEGVTPERHP